MQIDNSYYKKIIYKKNAFEDIKTFIKLNFNNKKILLVSSKSVQAEYVTSLLNSLFCGSENVSHFVSRQNFSQVELNMLNDKLKQGDFDLLVVLGGGRCTDTIKYFAYKYKLPYVVCPTIATSLAYFSNYCVNPYDATQNFYAEFPKKIFIQEQIIKNSTCEINIEGLCFLNALRAVFVEGQMIDNEKDRYVFLGLEKQFLKLEDEQTNILLCDEDSNLILMDMLIDFGFYIGQLNRKNFYLFNMYNIFCNLCNENTFAGKNLLVCSKAILLAMKNYIQLNNVSIIEKNNYLKISQIIKQFNISYDFLKTNKYLNDFDKVASKKKLFVGEKEQCYRLIVRQLSKIQEFCKKVKSVFKYGIEINCQADNVFCSLAVTPFIYKGANVVELMTNSGVLNAFL